MLSEVPHDFASFLHSADIGNPKGMGAVETIYVFCVFPEIEEVLIIGDKVIGFEKASEFAHLLEQIVLERETQEERRQFEVLICEFLDNLFVLMKS